MAVVESLEVVHIDHRHCDAPDTAREALIERAAIRQPGQRIDEGHAVRPVQNGDPDARRRGCEPGQLRLGQVDHAAEGGVGVGDEVAVAVVSTTAYAASQLV